MLSYPIEEEKKKRKKKKDDKEKVSFAKSF